MFTACSSIEDTARPGVLPAALPPSCIVAIAEPATRAYVTSGLESLGHPLVTAAHGFELVERLASAVLDDEPSARPALIVADAILPGCTGLSVLAGVRALGWRTPVILVTAAGDLDSRREAEARRATGVFSDPYELGALVAFARDTLAPAAGRRHRRPRGAPVRSRLIH